MDDGVPVVLGRSGAVVRRSRDGRSYAKSARPAHRRVELRDERDRLLWLATTAVPAAEVLDWDDDGEVATLTTAAVPGLPASSLAGRPARAAIETLAAFVTDLHAISVDECPFDRRLSAVVPLAARRVAAGLVDETDFDAERLGRSAEDVLLDLVASAPRATATEGADLAVCHGDLCLPNVLLTPDGTAVTGLVDVARLGVADRHQDLALLTRSMADSGLNPAYGATAAVNVVGLCPGPVDPWRLDFYRLLDEFF